MASHTEQCSKHLYQIVLWLQGVSLLLRVQHYHHQHQKHHFTDLQRIFQQSQITANSYTLARFRQQGIVYCRVTTAQQLQRFTYIGSTKLKQITSHKIVQAELALRWWHKHKCYHQFVPITLKTNIPDQDLEATENTFIQQHQSKLNFPFITNHMKGAFSGFTKAANIKHNGSGALWAKLRRGRLHHSIRIFTDTDLFRNRKQAWQTVSHLCSNTRARFDTTRQLLRSETPTSTILRCTNSPATSHGETADKPTRHYKQFYENGVSAHRQQPNLSMYNPSCTPLFERIFVNSSEPAYKMQNAIFYHSTFPPQRQCSRSIPPTQRILHNWRQAHSTWQPQQETECTCASLRSTVDSQHLHNNHIAIQLAELQPQHSFLAYSGKSNVLQKNSQLAAQLTKSIRAWQRHYHIPYNNQKTKEFQQLQQHDKYQQTHLNIQTLKHVQQQLPKGIIHCEDHCPNRLMWYCPALYNQAITNTFLDEQVFRTSEDSPLSHHYDVYVDVTTKLPDYQWAFPQRGRIPKHTSSPNAFQKGRPIVAFLDTMGRKLWEALADVLQLMTQQACPDAFHQGDGITQLTQTAAFLQGRGKQHDPNNYVFVQSGSGRILHIRGQRPIFISLQHHGQMVSRQKSSACRRILHRPLSKSSRAPGTSGQKQTKATRSIFRKQTRHSPQGHPTTHQRCPSVELLRGWPNTH